MIEKLNAHLYKDTTDMFEDCREKINELVDAVNSIVNVQEKLIDSRFVVETKNELPDGDDAIQEVIHADPYAEQRKWIGKACWFWDSGAKTRAFGKLNQVDTEYNDAPFQTNFGQWYEHCEPVSPEDDIIYKKD